MNIQSDPRQFILDYFSDQGTIPGNSELEHMACDYIQSGLIDSFGLLTLIAEIEDAFPIVLDGDDLESPRFKTIGGLIEIIEAGLNHQPAA